MYETEILCAFILTIFPLPTSILAKFATPVMPLYFMEVTTFPFDKSHKKIQKNETSQSRANNLQANDEKCIHFTIMINLFNMHAYISV